MRRAQTNEIGDAFLARAVATKVCPECKKKFDWYGEQWVYRAKHNGVMRYYCSYTCWMAEDKRKAARGISTLRGGNCAKW